MTSGFDVNMGHLIEDGNLLSDGANTGKPIRRQEELEQLRACLAAMRYSQPPMNVWLCGPPGSGKTSVARWVVDEVCGGSALRITVYVNCWQHRSLYGVLQAIIDQLKILRAEAQDTNFKFDRIRQALRGRPMVVILDEIDRPMPKQRDEIIYGLLSFPKTGVICIANSTQPLATLDERVRSRLSPVIITLPAYSQSELEAILTDRARRALTPDSWSPAIIKRIAELAHGDARLAIQALRQAAAAAEEAGRTKLDRRFIDHSLLRWQAVRFEARVASLSEHERIIRRLATQHGPVGTTRLRQTYAAYCHKQGLRPMARRTFSKYLNRLSAAGLLKVAARPAGPGGRIVRVTAA